MIYNVIKKISYRFIESFNILRNNGIRYLIKRYIYFNKIWVVVEKDLVDFEMKINPELKELGFTEISEDNFTKEMLSEQETDHFSRIQSYLEKGYHGLMLKRNDTLIGYIWYSLISADRKKNHPDVKLINITHQEPSAYMFSMYLRANERGNNMGVHIYSSLLDLLKKRGVSKAYAVYDKKNIPALWVNRMLKFKEIRRLKISQIIFYKFVASEPIPEKP